MGVIILKDMDFFAYHGCFSEEQIIGTRFSIDLLLEADTEDAEITDNLHKTIDYQQVYNVVKKQMCIKSKLLENVARRIITELVKSFPEIKRAEVTISKFNPPLGGQVSRVMFKLIYPFN
ncbi:MAG TPA: dihydroneopterin aldolase [Bacteroidales bacterium]|nr:dihydroneopterin aldolase [Bacteroidales bacterium]